MEILPDEIVNLKKLHGLYLDLRFQIKNQTRNVQDWISTIRVVDPSPIGKQKPQIIEIQPSPDVVTLPREEAMQQAIRISKKCKAEDDRIHPFVGAVIIKDNMILADAFRGEIKPGEHAEYTVLNRKCKNLDLQGSIMVTTLEPCTTRRHPKKPCALHIVDREIIKVFIGMLDPNDDVRGKGTIFLENHGVDVYWFPWEYRKQVKAINKHYWEEMMKDYTMDVMKS